MSASLVVVGKQLGGRFLHFWNDTDTHFLLINFFRVIRFITVNFVIYLHHFVQILIILFHFFHLLKYHFRLWTMDFWLSILFRACWSLPTLISRVDSFSRLLVSWSLIPYNSLGVKSRVILFPQLFLPYTLASISVHEFYSSRAYHS